MGIHCRHTHTIQEGHFFRTNFKLKRTLFYLSLHCSLFLFVFKEFPPSDEELDAYRNGEVCWQTSNLSIRTILKAIGIE